MAGFLEWTEPVAVRQWNWQTEGLPAMRHVFRLFGRWSVLLGVPSLFLVYRSAPEELPHVAFSFVALMILKPLEIAMPIWLRRNGRVTYAVRSKGLRCRRSDGAMLHHWKTVERCRIIPHRHLSGIRVLELRVKHRRTVYTWGFDPKRLDEAALRRALRPYLKG